MRIVFMGTPDFASSVLQALIDAGENVAAAVSQPDKPVGRKAELRPTPVRQTAEAAGIPVLQPKKLKDPEFEAQLRNLDPDVIVVAAYGQIIPPYILELPRYGCLNVHASLLPKYRGAAPIQWSILDGEPETGVCIMQMDEGLDTGDVLASAVVPVGREETGGSLFDKLAGAGAALLLETLPRVEAGSLTPVKQPEESPTPYARMIRKEDGQIDWTAEAAAIERQVRALDPWPAAYTRLDGKMLKIWKTHLPAEVGTNSGECDTMETGQPGMVRASGAEGIDVYTGAGILRITEQQLEGKKRMAAADFLRGHPLAAGTVFG